MQRPNNARMEQTPQASSMPNAAPIIQYKFTVKREVRGFTGSGVVRTTLALSLPLMPMALSKHYNPAVRPDIPFIYGVHWGNREMSLLQVSHTIALVSPFLTLSGPSDFRTCPPSWDTGNKLAIHKHLGYTK